MKMLIDIDRIVVNDRIRRDFGDLKELAEDIKQNTLLNALVVTPSNNGDGTYILIAGERRLRAMRDILGYKAVPVNTVGVEDAEQALLMEISENECRKEFTKTERLEYARRLARIEAAKAKERQGARTDLVADLPLSSDSAKTRDIVAGQLGTSATQLRREQFISDNAEMLDPSDFEDWDEGKLSTNKAFQRIKAAMAQAEQERDAARAEVATVRAVGDQLKRQRDEAREDAEGYAEDIKDLQAEIDALEKQSDRSYEDGYKAAQQQGQQPKVVERRVEVPSAADQRRIKELEHLEQLHSDDNAKLRRKLEETRRELDRAKGILGMNQTMQDVRRDVQYLISATNQYVRQYGGLTWTAASLEQVDEPTREELKKAATNLATFATALVASLEGIQ